MTMSISSNCISDLPVILPALVDLVTLPCRVVPFLATTTPLTTRLESRLVVNSAPACVWRVSRVSSMRTRTVEPVGTVMLVGLVGGEGGAARGGGGATRAKETPSTSLIG